MCNGKTRAKQHEKKQTMIGRALCRADWPADRLTGSLANWFGVFLVCSWKGVRHRVTRVSEEERERERKCVKRERERE